MGNPIFHNGLYILDAPEKVLRAINNDNYPSDENPDADAIDNPYDSAEVFIFGSCQLFALVLHEEFGYDVCEIVDNDDRLVHVFCKTSFNDWDLYVDVRGMTSDFTECFRPFAYKILNGYKIRKRDIGADISELSVNSQHEVSGYQFAKDIVHEFPDRYYIVPRLSPNSP